MLAESNVSVKRLCLAAEGAEATGSAVLMQQELRRSVAASCSVAQQYQPPHRQVLQGAVQWYSS